MSGGFHEVLMDSAFSYGALGGPQVATTVTLTKSGYRKVNRDWDEVKSRWNLAYGLKRDADVKTLRTFYVSRFGPLFGFRFWDRLNYEASTENLGWGNSTDGTDGTDEFQLRKLYYGTWTISATVTIASNVFTVVAPGSTGAFRDVLEDMEVLVSGSGNTDTNGLWTVDATTDDTITLSATDVGGSTAQTATDVGGGGVALTFTLAVEEKTILKPVVGLFTPETTTLAIYVDGALQTLTTHYTVDETTGIITFTAGNVPLVDEVVTWSGEYHIPVAFEKNSLDISMDAYEAGTLQDITIVELLSA